MQITFRYVHLDHTPALEEHAARKLASVQHLIEAYEANGEARAEVELERTTEHHRSGEVFKARVRLILPEETVEAEARGDDIYGVVDRVRDTLHGAVQRFKEHDVARRHGSA